MGNLTTVELATLVIVALNLVAMLAGGFVFMVKFMERIARLEAQVAVLLAKEGVHDRRHAVGHEPQRASGF